METAPQTEIRGDVKPHECEMTPASFRALGAQALGGRGWQTRLAEVTGWAPSTITRYLQGVLPIPRHAAVLIRLLAQASATGRLSVALLVGEDEGLEDAHSARLTEVMPLRLV